MQALENLPELPDLIDNKEEIVPTELSPEQKDKIIKRIEDPALEPPSMSDLGLLCFGERLDGRDKKIKLIKTFCASLSFQPKTKLQELNQTLILTEEQKEFIRNYAGTMNVPAICKELFNKTEIHGGSKEYRVVNEYIKQLNVAVIRNQDLADGLVTTKYKPPSTRASCIVRIEKCTGEKVDEKKLNQYQTKNIDALITHLHVYRFNYQINTYDQEMNRSLFESTFVRYVWPKASDLSSEEVDQFIVLSTEVVISANIQKRIESLQRLLDEAVEKEKDGENRRAISMNMIEAIGKLNDEYHQSVTRSQKLLNDLNVKRSERIKDRVSENQSLVSLIEFWKNYENRQQLIALAEMRKNAVKDEVERLKNIHQLKAEIFGVSEDIIDA